MAVMTFYSNFSKKENSTKQPTGGTSYNVVFKEGFSIKEGTVKLQVNFDTAKTYTAAKYVDKFYKVNNIVSITNGIVEISLSLDALATYRSAIIGYTGLLERAPSTSEINYLPDNTITSNGNLIRNELLWYGDLVLDAASCVQIKTSNSVSAQCYYTNLRGLVEFSEKLDSVWSGDNIKLISEINMVKLSLSDIGSVPQAVSTNRIVVGDTAYDVSAPVYAFYEPSVLELSYTPSLASINFTYSDARRIDSNYTKISFVINNTEIFLDSCYNRAQNFLIRCTLDINTLTVLTQIFVKQYTDNKLLFSGYTNIGISYSLSNDNSIQKKSISTAFRTVNGIEGGIISGIATKSYAGLVPRIPSLGTNVPASSSGSAPGTTLSMTDLFIKIYLYEYGSTEKSPSENGYPYYKVGSASTLGGGFYKFINPSVDIADIPSVRNEINGFLSRGFYYE